MLASSLSKFIRPEIRKGIHYQSARSLIKSAKIRLDANENTFGSVLTDFSGLNFYPDPLASKLRQQLAQYLKMSRQKILVGNGSDELIRVLLGAVIGPKEEVLIPEPTFSFYAASAKLVQAQVKKVWLTDFKLTAAKVLSKLTRQTKLIFLCSPNNPTGQVWPLPAIEQICQSQKIVVLDEAYGEFAPQFSAVPLLKKFPNLVILRTFSKAWGLAGLRIGYLIAAPILVQALQRVRAPYSVNTLSAQLAEKALGQRGEMEKEVEKIVLERERLFRKLQELDLQVWPSHANFLLVKFPQRISAINLQKKLLQTAGIAVRIFPQEPRLKNYWRITIGRAPENNSLLTALKKMLR